MEKVDFPDELLKQLHSYLLGNHIVSRMLDSFKLYGYDYEKVKIKHSQRNQEIRLLNDDRELPLVDIYPYEIGLARVPARLLLRNAAGDATDPGAQSNRRPLSGGGA